MYPTSVFGMNVPYVRVWNERTLRPFGVNLPYVRVWYERTLRQCLV